MEKFSWFHGNIKRAEAELMLSSVIDGSFLVREFKSKPGEYALSLRNNRRVIHYRITTDPQTSQYFLNREFKFQNLPELIVHHSKKHDGLKTLLRYPVPNPRLPHIQPFPQSEMNQSESDMGKKLGEGQYEEVTKKSGISEAEKTFRVRRKG